ncbi:MAG: transposase family protein, partial [Verrucomicrobia bacterium]|nr:transposase family protein [Verrucomicrobiota bacterium]
MAFRRSLEESFGDLADYRRPGSVRHQLLDILFITLSTVISGANDLKAVAMYAKRKRRWLMETLKLPNDI